MPEWMKRFIALKMSPLLTRSNPQCTGTAKVRLQRALPVATASAEDNLWSRAVSPKCLRSLDCRVPSLRSASSLGRRGRPNRMLSWDAELRHVDFLDRLFRMGRSLGNPIVGNRLRAKHEAVEKSLAADPPFPDVRDDVLPDDIAVRRDLKNLPSMPSSTNVLPLGRR